MMFRMFSLAVLALAPLVGGPALVADEYSLDGKLVSLTDNQLVISCKDGKEKTLTLAPDAQIKCDGRVCQRDALRAEMPVRAFTKPEDRKIVIRLEALGKQAAFDGTYDGKLVSITETELVMAGKKEQECRHRISPQAKMTCDGQPSTWEALKPGTRIRVTTKSEEAQWIVRIEAIDKQDQFEGTHDGKFVSSSENNLVMTNKAGKEQTLKVSNRALVTCDGQICTVDDIKAGMKIRITTQMDDRQLIVRIEAIEKQDTFDLLN